MKQTIRRFSFPVYRWWKRQSKTVKIILGLVVAIFIIVLVSKNNSSATTSIETVKRQNLVRSISASGMVVSSTDLSLGFEQSKKIATIPVHVGDTVKQGTILATLSNGTERAAVSSAKGTLLAARARYEKVLDGSSNEEIKLAQIQLDNAKRTQANFVANARRKLFSDSLIADPQSGTSDTAPVITGNFNGEDEGEYRISFSATSNNDVRYNGIEQGTTELSDLPKPLGTKGLMIAFYGANYNTNSSWKVLIPNKNSTNYTNNLNAYQAAQASADAAIAEAQAKLDITRATARQPDIDAALADMVTAQAGVDTANAVLEKTILRAPADGTITAVNVKVGEIPQLDKIAIALQDVSNLYLEANVNESNIKSVLIGQPVSVTFDAFPGDTYHASVSSIDPAATIENNVVNYKVKALLTDTAGIKPGMTANMVIKTAELFSILVLPNRVIDTKDGIQSVLLVTDERHDKAVEKPVTIGLKGDGDMVEIQSGLSEGDRVKWIAKTK